MTMKRRHFIKLGAGALAAAALARCSRFKTSPLTLEKGKRPYPDEAYERPNYRSGFAPSLCRECPAACGVLLRIVDGKAVGIKGNPLFPTNGGSLCPKGPASLQRLYHPDRVREAHMNDGGTGTSQSLTRKAALDLLASHLREAHGSRDAVAILCGSEWGLTRTLWTSLGEQIGASPVSFRTAGLDMVQSFALLGARPAPVGVDLKRCAFVLSLGSPLLEASLAPAATMKAYGEFRRGRDTRGHFIQVEPRLSITAAKADEWIPCAPGSYGTIALSLASVLLEEKLVDAAALGKTVEGLDAFAKTVAAFSPEKVSASCGISVASLRLMARELASRRPSAVMGWGSQSLPWSSVRDGAAVAALNMLLGSYGTPGGLVPLDAAEDGATLPLSDDQVLDRLRQQAGSLKCLLVVGDDPVGRSSRKEEWRALMEKLPFTACLTLEETPTSQHARLVLPAAHPYESFQDARGFSPEGSPVWGFAKPAVQGSSSAIAVADLPFELASRLGCSLVPSGKDFFECASQHLQSLGPLGFLPLPTAPAAQGQEAASRPTSPGDPWEQGGLYAPGLALKAASASPNLEPLASEWGVFEKPTETAEFPFHLHLHEPLVFSSATGASLPYLLEIPDPLGLDRWDTFVEVSPADALKLGAIAGDRISIESAHGSLTAKISIYKGLRPGTVSMAMAGPNQNRFAKGLLGDPLVLVGGARGARSGMSRQSPVPVRLRKG